MKLGDKPCYPVFDSDGIPTRSDLEFGASDIPVAMGLTFRERLIIALASNPKLIDTSVAPDPTYYAGLLTSRADAIIRALDKERK